MGFVSPLADGFPRVDQRLAALHVGVWRQGTVLAAALFRGADLQRELPFGAYGAAGSVPNRSWDEALASLDWPRLGRWLRYEPEQMWLAEVGQSASAPAGLPMVASRPDARYLVLTRARDGSGLVYGPMTVVRAAARVRLVDGVRAPGALVSAYVRAGDVLMSVDVETTRVEASACASEARPRYRVRTWLGQQVLGEDQFEL